MTWCRPLILAAFVWLLIFGDGRSGSSDDGGAQGSPVEVDEVCSSESAGREQGCGASWADPAALLQQELAVLVDRSGSRKTSAMLPMLGATPELERKIEMSVPLTLVHALRIHFVEVQRDAEAMLVYIIGADRQFDGQSDWTVMWRARPRSTKRLTVVQFFGEEGRHHMESSRLSCLGAAGLPDGLSVQCIYGWFPEALSKLNHQLVHSASKVPDLAFVACPGIPRRDRATWAPALEWLVARQVPTVWSHFGWVGLKTPTTTIPADFLLGVPDGHPDYREADYEGEAEEVIFTRLTLERFAEALGVTSLGWSSRRNPFSVFAPMHQPFNSPFSQGFVAGAADPRRTLDWNMELLLTGSRSMQPRTSRSVDASSLYMAAGDEVCALLVGHVGGEEAVRKAAGKLAKLGWHKRLCDMWRGKPKKALEHGQSMCMTVLC